MSSLPLAPVPNTGTRGVPVGMVGTPEGQGCFFYARDWLNTALGEGVALAIALVAGLWALFSLSAASIYQVCRGRAWATRSGASSPPRPWGPSPATTPGGRNGRRIVS